MRRLKTALTTTTTSWGWSRNVIVAIDWATNVWKEVCGASAPLKTEKIKTFGRRHCAATKCKTTNHSKRNRKGKLQVKIFHKWLFVHNTLEKSSNTCGFIGAPTIQLLRNPQEAAQRQPKHLTPKKYEFTSFIHSFICC